MSRTGSKIKSRVSASAKVSALDRRRAQRERRGDPDPVHVPVETPEIGGPAERRRASRFLWTACESLLSTESRSVNRALTALATAFDCDGVALHALGPEGTIEPWCARGAWRTPAGDLRDCMTVPLFRGEERVGTLELLARPGRRWNANQLGLIRTAAGTLGAALGARLELGRLRNLPGRDPLTGLPDAGAFHARIAEELARARRHALPAAVLSVDLDHLGELNSRYGRDVGDAVLAEAALVLKLQLRESDVVARLGGDDFGILLPETDREAALRCADRVRRALEEHRFARVSHVSASAGVAACPEDGADPSELLAAAERAVSLAKKAGRRRVAAAGPSAVH